MQIAAAKENILTESFFEETRMHTMSLLCLPRPREAERRESGNEVGMHTVLSRAVYL